MKTADWKVLINSREFWDTQSRRTACQPVFQSHRLEQQWLQTLQASPHHGSQVRTVPYVELRGDPELRLWSLTAAPLLHMKGRGTQRTWNPRLSSLLINFKKIKITYANCCCSLQLGHDSPFQTSVLHSHSKTQQGALALNPTSRIHLLQASTSTHCVP